MSDLVNPEDAGEATPTALSYREALASVQAMLDECEKDPEKIKQHFGYIETSAGDL